MKTVITTLLLLASTSWGFDYQLKPQKINNDVYCFFGSLDEPNKINNGFMVNSCFIKDDGFYTVIDSGPTYLFAKQAHEAMNKIANLPVKYVVNTHSHDDHFLGNGYFKSKGAKIFASIKFPENQSEDRMGQIIKPEAYAGTTITKPDEFLSQGNLQIGNAFIINLDLHGHTTGDIIIWHPKSKTLFAGDLVFNDRILSLRDGTLKGWLSYIDAFAKYDYQYLIGGHGSNTSKNSYVQTKDYLTRLQTEVKKMIESSVGIDDAAKNVKFNDFANLSLYNELHSKNVFKAYQLLEWE